MSNKCDDWRVYLPGQELSGRVDGLDHGNRIALVHRSFVTLRRDHPRLASRLVSVRNDH